MSASYPTPEFRRTALAPGLLGGIVSIVGTLLLGGGGYTIVQYAVAILALIVAWFAFQARAWWWIIPLVAVAVLWNPVLPVNLDRDVTLTLAYAASAIFIAAAITIKIRNPEDRNKR